MHLPRTIERAEAQMLPYRVDAEIIFVIALIDQKEHWQIHQFRRLPLTVELVKHLLNFLHSTLI